MDDLRLSAARPPAPWVGCVSFPGVHGVPSHPTVTDAPRSRPHTYRVSHASHAGAAGGGAAPQEHAHGLQPRGGGGGLAASSDAAAVSVRFDVGAAMQALAAAGLVRAPAVAGTAPPTPLGAVLDAETVVRMAREDAAVRAALLPLLPPGQQSMEFLGEIVSGLERARAATGLQRRLQPACHAVR